MKHLNKMKAGKDFLFACFLFVPAIINAQMGIGTSTPAASAQLDVTSNNKGFLPPRLTQQQRNAIASPAPGLMIWCRDCGIVGELQVYNGYSWTNMTGGNSAKPLPQTVTIGTQNWMTRNLDVITFKNGDTIPRTGWCYYNNDSVNGALFGKLYSWDVVNDPRGLAPVGWHIPTTAEWRTLSEYIGEEDAKIRAAILWETPITSLTNESGFTAIPGGYLNDDGVFADIGSSAYWWCSDIIYYTPHDYPPPGDPIFTHFFLRVGVMVLEGTFNSDSRFFSVRCVKD